jgi:anchored repeat-type ABC transporter ATP-binding subunit
MPAIETLPAAISVNNVCAGYPGIPEALHQIRFSVQPGERIGVLGANGAGKSTLLKAIAGLIPVREGQILIHGQPIGTPNARVGYVPQHNSVNWQFPITVREAVMMGRTREIGWLKRATRQDWQLIDDLIARVGMQDMHARQIGQLSGGQRQRVFIARALAQRCNVLLLDEPFAGVDKSAEEELWAVLDHLRADGITVLMATHDLMLASTQFDRLLLLNRHVIAFDTPSAVFTPDHLQAAFGKQLGILHSNGQHYVVMN